jgi:predicted porin
MKLKSIAAVTCGMLLASGHVYAQSSVTLYGIVDVGITYVHNSGGHSSQWKMSGGNMSGSRWGMLGTEDLGGGLKTVFRLENGFNPTNGQLSQGGREFGRQAYVGLSHDQWGTFTLGRQYDAVVSLEQPITLDHYFMLSAAPGDPDNYDNSIRFDNTVKWSSPNWSGFQAQATYSLGGVAGQMGAGQSFSAAAAYTHGPFSIAGGYFHIDYGRTATAGVRVPTSTGDSLFNSSVNRGYASAKAVDSGRVGAQYVIGPVTLGGSYSYSEYKPDALSIFTVSEKYKIAMAYGVWQVTPALLLGTGYTNMKTSGDSSATYNQFSLGADYVLSKRTDVWLVGGHTHASGQTRVGSGLAPAQAVVSSINIDSGRSTQDLVVFGIRHRF